MTIVDDFDLRARYDRVEGSILLTGIQALVRLPVEQHRADARRNVRTATLVTGYEGSPLGGYDLALAREADLLAEHEVRALPNVNEDLAATAIWGSQHVPRMRQDLDGVVGIWYGKTPGVDRAGDALRHGNYSGAHPNGGVLVLAGDDPACKSSTLPGASEGTLADLGMPVLSPASIQDVLDLGLHGIALSRYSGSWVGMKITTDVADGFATVEVSPNRVEPKLTDLGWEPVRRAVMMPPHSVASEADVFGPRIDAVLTYATANNLNEIVANDPDARIGLVAAGKTFTDLSQALSDLGVSSGIRLLKLGLVTPLEPDIIKRFATGLDEIVVVEEKRPFVERAIRDILYPLAERPAVVGSTDEENRPLIPIDGELTADRIAPPLAARLERALPGLDLASRVEAIARANNRAALQNLQQPSPVFLQRMPAQPLDDRTRRIAYRRRHRLPCDGPVHRRRPSHWDLDDPDGRRGRSVGRTAALQRSQSPLPEHRRRHIFPLWLFGRSSVRQRRGRCHVQGPLQRRRRHDRRADSSWSTRRARSRSTRAGRRCEQGNRLCR